MLVELICAGETTRADLADGVVRVGGGKADEIRISGLPPTLLRLRIDGERLTVTASRTMSIGRSMFAAHVPRLVVAGELVHLSPTISLRQVPAASHTKGTATVMRDLLRGELDLEHTRAARLTCLTGVDAGNVAPIAYAQMTLGRGDECTLQVRDRAVSRKHAKVTQRDGRVWLEDLRGPNGTYVNGQRVQLRVALQPGDVIELGQTLLRYDAPAVEQPAPLPRPAPPIAVRAAPPASRWPGIAFACGAAALIAAIVAALTALG
jgi:hypothetical protein